MNTYEIIQYMFKRIIEDYDPKEYILYSVEVISDHRVYSLYLKHDSIALKDRIVYVIRGDVNTYLNREHIDFLKSCKEIGNRYIRELNATP